MRLTSRRRLRALDVELAPGESAVVPEDPGASGLATHDLEVSDLPALLGTEDSSCDS